MADLKGSWALPGARWTVGEREVGGREGGRVGEEHKGIEKEYERDKSRERTDGKSVERDLGRAGGEREILERTKKERAREGTTLTQWALLLQHCLEPSADLLTSFRLQNKQTWE